METETYTETPTITQDSDGSWTVRYAGTVTDAQAAAVTFRAEPAQVRLGAFVAVEDAGGTRIGRLTGATYHTRAWAPAYVVCTITLH